MAQEGTASIAGKAEDTTGAGVPGTQADLHSEKSPYQRYRAVADDVGKLWFPTVFAGDYTLDLQQTGFRRLIVKGISVSEGEKKVLPTLRIEVGSMDCGSPVLDYLRLGGQQGSLTGSVGALQGPGASKGKPVAAAEVTLICGKATVCGATKTNSKGEFLFQNLAPGSYAIRANHAGFYPLVNPSYEVREGLDSIYFPIYLEPCQLGNCDPRLRPKKPLVVCE
jgi:hypothetical protein